MLNQLKHIDKELFTYLNAIHSPFFDGCMQLVSGNIIWIPFYIWVLYALFRKLQRKAFLILLPFIALSVTLSDQISVRFFKNIFLRYRPCHNLELAEIVHLVDGCGGQYGFVSSHAANVFGIAMLTTLIFKNKTNGFALFSWAILVSYSRIYLGVHYPADILGGAVLGMLIGSFVFILFQFTLKKVITKA